MAARRGPVAVPGSPAQPRRFVNDTTQKRGAGPKADSPFLPIPRWRESRLVAGTRTVGDLHAPVLRLPDTVGGFDQRPAFAERLRGDHAVGDAVAGQVRPDIVGTTLA